MSEPTSGDVNQPAGATIPPAPGEKSRADSRDLKCTLPADEFWAVQWAARHTPWKMPDGRTGKSSSLADWLRGAVLARVRETVRAEIARGKSIPPDIAAVIDEKRGV